MAGGPTGTGTRLGHNGPGCPRPSGPPAMVEHQGRHSGLLDPSEATMASLCPVCTTGRAASASPPPRSHLLPVASQTPHRTPFCRHLCPADLLIRPHTRLGPPFPAPRAPHFHNTGLSVEQPSHSPAMPSCSSTTRTSRDQPPSFPSTATFQGPDRDIQGDGRTHPRSSSTTPGHSTARPGCHFGASVAQDEPARTPASTALSPCAAGNRGGVLPTPGAFHRVPSSLPMDHLQPGPGSSPPVVPRPPIVLCPQCQGSRLACQPPSPRGAAAHGPFNQTDYTDICTRYHHVITTSPCRIGDPTPSHDCPHHPILQEPQEPPAPGSLNPTRWHPWAMAEDYAMLPALFSQFTEAAWLANLPMPIIDAWGCPHQHQLPVYSMDFFATIHILQHYPLYINCRFSAMLEVVRAVLSHKVEAYIVAPHWENSDWWPLLHQHSRWTFTLPVAQHTFKGIHQRVSLPCPWSTHIFFISSGLRVDQEAPQTLHAEDFYRSLASKNYTLPSAPGYFMNLNHHDVKAKHVHQLPLAPVSTTILTYSAVLTLASELHFDHTDTLRAMFKVLQSEAAFLHACTRRLASSRGKPSHLTPPRLQEAIQYGILAKPIGPPYQYHPVFPIIKSDGLSTRLCQDPAPVNDAMKRLWKCQFMRLHDMIQVVCGWSYAVEADAQSFYYQFPLAPAVSRWFGVRQRASPPLVMTKMPQGWVPFCPSGSSAKRSGFIRFGQGSLIASTVPILDCTEGLQVTGCGGWGLRTELSSTAPTCALFGYW